MRNILPEKSHIGNLDYGFLPFRLAHTPDRIAGEPQKNLHIVQLPRLLDQVAGLSVGVQFGGLYSASGFVKRGAPNAV